MYLFSKSILYEKNVEMNAMKKSIPFLNFKFTFILQRVSYNFSKHVIIITCLLWHYYQRKSNLDIMNKSSPLNELWWNIDDNIFNEYITVLHWFGNFIFRSFPTGHWINFHPSIQYDFCQTKSVKRSFAQFPCYMNA